MHFDEEEAKRLPIGTFDHLQSKRDRNGERGSRYRDPNLLERSFGLPIAIVALVILMYVRPDDTSVGLAVAFLIIVAFVWGEWGLTAGQNHQRMWEEVFALRGGLAHALAHSSATCTGCDDARRLVPEWDAEMRANARAGRDAP